MVGVAERTVLLEGALAEAEANRADVVADDRGRSVFCSTRARPGRAGRLAGARVRVDAATGLLDRVEVRVAAGDPLDEIVLRSYCMGAAHMALGWVLSEGVAVDPETGEVLDLTIRSFGVIRPKRHASDRRDDRRRSRSPRPALGRRVRRSRGGDVERGRARRRHASRSSFLLRGHAARRLRA